MTIRVVVSEPHATADLETEIVAEERVLFDRAVAVNGRPGILHGSIAGIDAHKGACGGLELNAAADVECEPSVACG
jgi:hypothetical protein